MKNVAIHIDPELAARMLRGGLTEEETKAIFVLQRLLDGPFPLKLESQDDYPEWMIDDVETKRLGQVLPQSALKFLFQGFDQQRVFLDFLQKASPVFVDIRAEHVTPEVRVSTVVFRSNELSFELRLNFASNGKIYFMNSR